MPAGGSEFGRGAEGEAPKVVYLVEGRQLGYGNHGRLVPVRRQAGHRLLIG